MRTFARCADIGAAYCLPSTETEDRTFSGSCALTSSVKSEETSPTAPALCHAVMFPPTRLCQTSGGSPCARRVARTTWAWEPPPPTTAVSSTEVPGFCFS